MAVTKEQATATKPWSDRFPDGAQVYAHSEFHYGTCAKHVGPRGGVTLTCERWRRNGATKTWKREPDRFEIPIKYGMRTYHYIVNHNAANFHLASDCPIEELRGY